MSRLCSGVLAATHHRICDLLVECVAGGERIPRLLDVGCWDGEQTLRYAARLGCAASGIEIFDGPASEARARGVEVAQLDLECERFPWPDHSMGVVVANQVFEHLKNVWLPMSEIFRVLRVGGHVIISVPNLTSLHNRILFAFGMQPTSIRTFGPHVRGYAFREIERFVAYQGALSVRKAVGVGFYPLPARASAPLSRLWPRGSHTCIVVAQKTEQAVNNPWSDYIDQELRSGLQTFYT